MAALPQSIDLTRKLIAFDTTSRNSNLALIDFVRDYLDAHDVKTALIPDETGKKANLYGTIGADDRPGICLSGHTDVVPIDGQDWTSDPWALTEKGGKLYGRGSCDMKGFLGCVLSSVPQFSKTKLATPLHLLFSFDEEVGCLGVRRALSVIKDLPVKPKGCIIGEPTSMQVAIAHKGKKSMRAHVHGKECHSSLAPKGVNAVEYAAEAIAFLRGMGRRFAAEGPFDHDYDVPHTTVHTGVVRGGILQPIEREIEVECLPLDIPEYFNVDVSGLDIGDSAHIEDLVMPEGVTAIYESNLALVAVVPPTVEEAPAAAAAPVEGAEAVAATAEAAPAKEEED